MSFGQPPSGGGFGTPPPSSPGGGFGAPPGGPGGGFGAPPVGSMGVPPGGPSTDPLAIASLVVSLFGLLPCFCCSLLGGVVGITAGTGIASLCGLVGAGLGAGAIVRINREPEQRGGKGLAIGGAVLGGLAFVLMGILCILAIVLGAAYVAQFTGGGYGGGRYGY